MNNSMNDCCKETYRKTLEEVVRLILNTPGKSYYSLVDTLKYAIKVLKENETKTDEIKLHINEFNFETGKLKDE